MKSSEVITILALIIGPVMAVIVGQYLQNRERNYNLRKHLFLTLIAYRSSPLNPEFVRALNQICVVFHGREKVQEGWKKHYGVLCNRASSNFDADRESTFLDLIQEMAIDLGYKEMRLTSVKNHYLPQAYGDRDIMDVSTREALLVFLQNGATVFEYLKNEASKKTPQTTVNEVPKDQK